MFQALKQPGWSLAAMAMISLANLSACKPASSDAASARAELKQARDRLAAATERLSRGARPVTDRAALAARLKLDPKRFAAIKTGGPISGQMTASFNPGSDCKFGHCTCYGDSDCNEMFTGICRNPSTDGSCEEHSGETVCTCKYVDG
ncbi:MAG TPA: hypothetical protein VEA61_12740 [Allosphingosinicella sp.]|nr:hypothetical protein [Allosphingosinicella sp.]